MTILGLPATKRPASVTWTLEHNVGVSANPIGNTIQRVARDGGRWRATITQPPQVGDDAGVFQGWLDRVSRGDNWFWLDNPGSIARGNLAPVNLVSNGYFTDGSTSGWFTDSSSVALSVNARRLKVANASGSPAVAGGAYSNITMTAGYPHTVVVDFDAGNCQSATVQIRNATTFIVEASRKLTSPGRFVFSVTPSQAAMQIRLVCNSDGHLFFRNVTVHRSMLVSGASQSGTRLNVDGLPVSTNALLKAGEEFCVKCGGNYELKRLVDDLDSDSGGAGTLVFEPALRISPDDNEAVTVYRPFGRFILPQHQSAASIVPPASQPIRGFTFDAVEDVTVVTEEAEVTDTTEPGLAPAAYYKFNTGITSAGGAVSQWDDQSGNARHLLQATGTNQPALQGDGSILFDGVDNFMRVAYTRNQPRTVLMLVKQVSWTSADIIIEGVTNVMRISQGGVSPNLTQSAGTAANGIGGPAIGVYGNIAAIFNGASSYTRVNSTTVGPADAGANNTSGLTLAANAAASPTAFANVQVKEVLDYPRALTATEIDAIFAYWATL